MRKSLIQLLLKIYHANQNLNRIFMALAAGLLTKKLRREFQNDVWQEHALDYLTPETIFKGWHPWERDTVIDHAPAMGKALVVGSGGGREMMALCAMGYEVEGIDVSAEAVTVSNQYFEAQKLMAKAVQASCEEFEFNTGPYALVYFSWYVYSYVFPRQFRKELLKKIASSLEPEGCVVMLLLSNGMKKTGKLTFKIAHLVSTLTLGGRPLEKGDWFDSKMMVEHVFTKESMEEEAAEAQLEVVEWRSANETVAVLRPICVSNL